MAQRALSALTALPAAMLLLATKQVAIAAAPLMRGCILRVATVRLSATGLLMITRPPRVVPGAGTCCWQIRRPRAPAVEGGDP